MFSAAHLTPAPEGTTVITGPNGAGKTTLLEAVAYLGTQRSFRGAPREVMVRVGAPQAFIRAQLHHDGRPVLVEAELRLQGRSRIQVNRQPVGARRPLAEAVPVTVFSPEDLALVQGAPASRRDLLDDALRLLDARASALIDQVERILRQRGALLRQSAGRMSAEIEATLGVWDDRLAVAGTALVEARSTLVADLAPHAAAAYEGLAGSAASGLALAYRRSFEGPLASALANARADDLRRAVSTVGPHRDDLGLSLSGRDARQQASQGEQRCVALALRLAVHRLATLRVGSAPLLLLDDVFSELDPQRSRALVAELPGGQALLTTAVPLPPGVEVAEVVDVTGLGQRADELTGRDGGTVTGTP